SIHQRVDSNIILLDWLTAGRVALGECWQFTSYSSKTSIFIEDQLVFRDSVQLSDKPTCTVKQSMDGYTAIAMCVIIGPQLKQLCDESMERIGKRKSIGHQQERDVMVTVSKLDCNVNNTDIHGIVVRIAAYSTTQAFLQIEKILSSVYPRLGGNPFQNKY
ncbi:uncharacterized protein LOC102803281, partial [Saccoglossus kowalevskii]|uniref:Urease accessory protein D-like n=1 Tax=Saccoglossus kowalevskii TaxID=10224 RepID=A0ABM0MV20_SACKO